MRNRGSAANGAGAMMDWKYATRKAGREEWYLRGDVMWVGG
jgi:hypothetical protein